MLLILSRVLSLPRLRFTRVPPRDFYRFHRYKTRFSNASIKVGDLDDVGLNPYYGLEDLDSDAHHGPDNVTSNAHHDVYNAPSHASNSHKDEPVLGYNTQVMECNTRVVGYNTQVVQQAESNNKH